ncbi:hypothetical protein QE152_g23167 [Popillia japonica]|uniref:Uncharacterized protein n=1 Tax=Popillia japonica TaxID=7064 RepID=A0AAW1KIK5_POPJA
MCNLRNSMDKFIVIGCLLGLGYVRTVESATEEVKALVGSEVSLPCYVDTKSCGKLHSVKFYRETSRIFVYSETGGISRGEGDAKTRVMMYIKDLTEKFERIENCGWSATEEVKALVGSEVSLAVLRRHEVLRQTSQCQILQGNIEDIRVQSNRPCYVDTKSCGKLHSVKFYRKHRGYSCTVKPAESREEKETRKRGK